MKQFTFAFADKRLLVTCLIITFVLQPSAAFLTPQQHRELFLILRPTTTTTTTSRHPRLLHAMKSSRQGSESTRRAKSALRMAFWNKVMPTTTNQSNIDSDSIISSNGRQENDDAIPFVVRKVGKSALSDFQQIACLCIDVFFNEEAERAEMLRGETKPSFRPWKAMQLAYLRNLQYGDFRARKTFSNARNEMFVARRVIPATADTTEFVDATTVVNSRYLSNGGNGPSDHGYTCGEILGFVEVTERQFGLADSNNQERDYEYLVNSNTTTNNTRIQKKNGGKQQLRPVVTNLSVKKEARRSGVGSRLIRECEQIVQTWPMGSNNNEIILQVEKDNGIAQKFYKKRGYEQLFADPACRRYDVSGLFLRQVPTTKICYRKALGSGRQQLEKNSTPNQLKEGMTRWNNWKSLDFFRKIRDTVSTMDS